MEGNLKTVLRWRVYECDGSYICPFRSAVDACCFALASFGSRHIRCEDGRTVWRGVAAEGGVDGPYEMAKIVEARTAAGTEVSDHAG
jgi:hypothetical protein